MSRLVFVLLMMGALQLGLSMAGDWKVVSSTRCFDQYYVNDLHREIENRRMQIIAYQDQTDNYAIERADVKTMQKQMMSDLEKSRKEIDRLKANLCLVKGNIITCIEERREAAWLIEEFRRDNELDDNVTNRMSFACRVNNNTAVEALLDLGLEVNLPITPEKGTCLHSAAANNNLELATLLVQRGADVNARTSPDSNWTPLMTSSLKGSFKIAQFLVEHGADLTVRTSTKDNRTALGVAKFNNKTDLIQLLQSKDAPE